MGSFFAGIKAGTLGGVLYLGGLAVFNVVLLYALKTEVLAAIRASYPQVCTPVEDCFASLIAVDVPYVAFVGFFIALIYAGIFGRFYENLPGTPILRGETISAIVAVNLSFFGFSGFYFNFESSLATAIFLIAWSGVFGYVLARLYKRYTRTVAVQSVDPESLRVIIDGRDFTGKSRTFAYTSSHRLRAEVANDSSFREWQVEGALTLEDPRSFETVMEVNGEGTVRGIVSKKY